MTINEAQAINVYAKRLNKSKWEVMLRTDNGIQVKKIKRLSRLGFWSGLLLLPFWGIGFIIWILAILDYLLQQEKILFISTDEIIKQLKLKEDK